MKPRDALLERWDKILTDKKEAPAILNARGQISQTFRQIEERAQDFARKIDIWPAGSVIAVQIGNHEDWPAIFLACLRRELAVLPLEQSISEQQRDAALKICNAAGIVAAAVSGGRELAVLPMTTSAATTDWGKNTPALLKLTSGTTAAPRAIRFRSEQLLADCDQICETMGIEDADLNFAVIPISHSYGFSNLLTPLLGRGVPMVLSRDRTPRAVVAAIGVTNATVFPGTPVFYQAISEMDDVPELSKLRLCISAGAPLPIAVAQKFRERHPIHSFYGASECGGICYDREVAKEIEGFVGPPMKDVDLTLLDPDAKSSQVQVRSAAVGDGYFPEADDEKLSAGCFVPDDLLEKTPAGFRIVGRISDVINVAGKKVSPAEVEACLLGFHGVRRVVVFARKSARRNEEVVACVVADPQVGEDDLLRFCRDALSPWQVPKRIFFVDAIPANERGKISRRELSTQFASS